MMGRVLRSDVRDDGRGNGEFAERGEESFARGREVENSADASERFECRYDVGEEVVRESSRDEEREGSE
jgi:hypothetical protein